VTREHPSMRLRAAPAWEGDDGGAVVGRDVPTSELEAVARHKRDLFVGHPESCCGDGLAHDVRNAVAECDRVDHPLGDDVRGAEDQESAQVAAAPTLVKTTRSPERREPDSDQGEARRECHKPAAEPRRGDPRTTDGKYSCVVEHSGGAGRDRLLGSSGRDRLDGGPGRDVIRGGLGRDRTLG
jgi:RTX calcium-binding nonapeptide repeat (4 copies)